MRNQKGITLVALVITIIVLLILAGVSISLVLGQNGVLTQASNAVIKNDKATAMQEVQMGAADATAAYYEAWATNSTTNKSTFYTQTRFGNNCQGASTVTLQYSSDLEGTGTNAGKLIGADAGYVKVTYTSSASQSTYNFYVNIADGSVTDVVPKVNNVDVTFKTLTV